MADISEQFDKVAAQVKELKSRPSDNELLQLYGLYKQATVGDNNTEQPSFIRLEARRKWDSWCTKKGMSKEEAMKKYVEYAETMIKTYGLNT